MSESVLRDRAKAFARKIVFLCRDMRNNHVEYVLIKQTIASGTSIAANLHEAQYAQGTKDFISKMEIALKECNEVDFWLELLADTDTIPKQVGNSLRKDCVDMRRMLVSTIRTMKAKLEQEQKK
jgi:four helix bundle protein